MWFYYTSRQRPRRIAERSGSVSGRAEARPGRHREEARGRRRKTNTSVTASGSESAGARLSSAHRPAKEKVEHPDSSKNKPQKRTPASSSVRGKEAGPAQERPGRYDDEDEADASNKDFAKQMMGLKVGHNLQPAGREGSRPRAAGAARADSSAKHLSVTSHGANGSSSQDLSANSSTTGGDADDDLSPAVSPQLAATSNGQHVSGADISDMLEAPSAGPSVLRIVESNRPQAPARAQQQKPAAAQETKKQRQNRRKAEEKKAVRIEAEQERRVLLEKQLRTAREAEGRPARNGLASSRPPVASPWSTSGPPAVNGNSTAGAGVMDQNPLLDTFGPAETQNGGRVSKRTEVPSGADSIDSSGTRTSSIWDRDLPSEEDQLRMIQEMEDGAGWNTVAKGRKSKKTRNGLESSDIDAPFDSGIAFNDSYTADAISTAQPIPAEVDMSASIHSNDAGPGGVNGRAGFSHPADSDWAVV